MLQSPARLNGSSMRVLAVIVLYRMQPSHSKTLAGLAQAFAEDAILAKQIDVLVWDNSPAAADERTLPFPCTYRHAAQNEGVSGAYNAAAVTAAKSGSTWLLLLDQDTLVTAEFLRGMMAHAEAEDDPRVAAVVPFLYAGSFCISPRLWRFGRHAPLKRSSRSLIERQKMFAANSGTLMRARALQAIGGYSRRFWLDYSDIEVFHRLHAHGFAVRIAGDLALEHEVALLDYDSRMTPTRYAAYLAAESDFLDLYRGFAERFVHLFRLAARSVRQLRYANPAFSQMSRRELWRRMFTGRRMRLRVRDELTSSSS